MGTGASSSKPQSADAYKTAERELVKASEAVTYTPSTADALSEAPTRVGSVASGLDQAGGQTCSHRELSASVVHAFTPKEYGSLTRGEPDTFEFRKTLTIDSEPMSYWHDIPLGDPGRSVQAVIEIPRDTKAKFEIATCESANPIKQDVKKGKLRDYNIPINWNYGALPQTWEQPDHAWEGCEGHAGDNDPVDIVDISKARVESGSVIQFKPITALAMIDEGEVDWKVIGINMADPLAARINSLEDLEAVAPGEVDAVREWFTWYKAVDEEGNKVPGKEPNHFALDGKPLSTAGALQVIAEAHACWLALVTRKVQRPPKIQLA